MQKVKRITTLCKQLHDKFERICVFFLSKAGKIFLMNQICAKFVIVIQEEWYDSKQRSDQIFHRNIAELNCGMNWVDVAT